MKLAPQQLEKPTIPKEVRRKRSTAENHGERKEWVNVCRKSVNRLGLRDVFSGVWGIGSNSTPCQAQANETNAGEDELRYHGTVMHNLGCHILF